ncbi:MAG: thermonuclease family protein [Acinetobacter sp.]|nr:thermonuclease family protein [Acinetobacter sp.]DAB11100.1 MAG TPA: hypothetical protein CPT91_06915 [Candidatus Gastranaerophilales bacterium HUM_16]DAB16405.1 MAG TPA: hypothetical protein CPT97_06310 [Candidatus Gastranaerophilales bacterium HUM_17]DAB17907.1 MAG TPA: hypothetical protein CPT98_05190 [Candidatus Gastranaerophilales bacterium HUM_19]DAB25127.1 MAG TPA: hypothetical protein CPT86_08510 [Candidatus Gastranaerophilales bacterium HUM_23]
MNKLLTTLMLFTITASVVFAETKIPVQLIKIKDGDTIDVKIEKNTFPVRLIGIDCYETGRIHRAYRQAYDNNLSIDEVIARGKQSTAYLENLYRANKNNQVYIDFKGVDIYGRALGVIYFDKLNVNEDLQKNGGCMIYNYE